MNTDLYGNWWLPKDLSLQGGVIDSLIFWLHLFMFVLFIGWGVFMVYCMYTFRARPGHKADYRGTHATWSKWVEAGIVVFEIVILFFISIPAWNRLKLDMPPAEENPLTIRVIAQQFAWNFHYPGPDGEFGRTRYELVDESQNPIGLDDSDPAAEDDVVTLNQICVPVGRPVIIRLSSKDVLHSFSIPLLRVKQDAVPGMEIDFWFEADPDYASEPDSSGEYVDEMTYDVACAQLCGITHSGMKGYVRIRTEEGFNAWLEEQAVEEFFDEDEFEDE